MDNDKEEIESQMLQAKKHYRNLIKMHEELETEIDECVDHYILCHIHSLLLDKYNISMDLTKNLIDRHFRDRFWMNEDTPDCATWCGTYKFNFADLVFDQKFMQRGIIVKETKTYITIWFFEIDLQECNTKNRNKEDKTIIILKRCDLS